MTDRDIVKKDIEELYLGNLGTVEFDLDLPSAGKNGSTITWQSGNLAFMNHEGKVTRPAYGRGNREVPLTARFTHGAYTEEKQYIVTVLEEHNQIEVEEIFPIALEAAAGETVRLPSASAVRTRDGRVIAHLIDWEDGLERVWDQPGTFSVRGVLKDTSISVAGEVRVTACPAPEAARPQKLAAAFPDGVTLLEGSSFHAAQERMHDYLLRTNPDQWLYNFRRAAGLSTRNAPAMTGWDSPSGLLRGHSAGHYLSALALCWHATGDREIHQKAVYMVDALKECQDAFAAQDGYHPGFLSAYSEEQFDLLEEYTPYPKIWAPYYTLHKILAGLLDLHRLAGIEKAFEIASGIGDWVYARLSRLNHEKRVRMWGIYIAGEYGGMNESMAELYRITGKKDYLDAARYFDNDRLFYPLEQNVDALTGMHANQHIPQIVGAMKLYEVTGERRYYSIAERFWSLVSGSRMYAIGGAGESEMFHEPRKIAGLLTKSTSESCATYNMLKLTKELYQYRPDAAYMDYYERAVTNHILSSCDHRPTSGSTYFLSMLPRAVKDFDASENSCCHGTGMESHFKYVESIYYAGEDCVYINLFLPSRLCLEGFALTMRTEEAYPEKIHITIESDLSTVPSRKLRIRKPFWTDENVVIRLNGVDCAAPLRDGYFTVAVDQPGTSELDVEFSCGLRFEKAPDRPDYFTVHYGPYVLAALTTSEERLSLKSKEPETAFVREENRPLAFRCKENGVLFIPFEKVWREEYQVYIREV